MISAKIAAGLTGLCLLIVISPAFGQDNRDADAITIRDGLVIRPGGRGGRNPIHTDPIEEKIVRGKWKAPSEGEALNIDSGEERKWTAATADQQNTFTNAALRGNGYLFTKVHLDKPEVKILEAVGHNLVYVNGELHAGDPYSYGYSQIPVALHAGDNEFLFQVGRGRLKAQLLSPASELSFNLGDPTLPDIQKGNEEGLWGAVIVINSSTKSAKDLKILAAINSGESRSVGIPSIPPLSLRKVPFKIPIPANSSTNKIEIALKLVDNGGKICTEAKLELRVRERNEQFKKTFFSAIDGSLQYFGVTPADPSPVGASARSLFLSTHGASVEAIGQAQAYLPKTWGVLVAPTNRRPYGFDWEDWGRMDALEVLDLALKTFKTDPQKTYLTGHSMGGHGTWQLGVTFPDRFAAIAPSAGWISFVSYAGASRAEPTNEIEKILRRASSPSDTLSLASNYLHHGIYILHGDADDNVPVSEARKMREVLSEFHHDFIYHEQPGAGHWWGNQCVDWPPIFDMFAHHQIPEDRALADLQFSTANPGISSRDHWARILQQREFLARSSFSLHYDAANKKLHGQTENINLMAIDLGKAGIAKLDSLELDDEKLHFDVTSTKLILSRVSGKWSVADEPGPKMKGPHRNGPFKEAFQNRMVFVYGTHGTPEENAWVAAKARYDAEQWWYRGNGAVDVFTDSEFDPDQDQNRGVILYGNAANNSCWKVLLPHSPVEVSRERVKIGRHEFRGDDLACLFALPRPNSDRAMVAVVSGTGLSGLKLTDRIPYFVSGVAFPDCTVIGADSLHDGMEGVRAVGFFGNDWSVEEGTFAFRE